MVGQETDTTVRISSFYQKGTCRFGISGRCPRIHSKPCCRLMQHGNKGPRGCSRGNDSDRFHFKVRPSSLARGECFSNRYPSPHVKGTHRIKVPGSRPGRGRQDFMGVEGSGAGVRTNLHHRQNNFLSTTAALKIELMDAMNYRLQTIQTRIQQVYAAESSHFYPQIQPQQWQVIPHRAAPVVTTF